MNEKMLNQLINADMFKIDICKEINDSVKKKIEETFQKLQLMKSETDDSQDQLSYPMSYSQMTAFPPLTSPSKPALFLSSTEERFKPNDINGKLNSRPTKEFGILHCK